MIHFDRFGWRFTGSPSWALDDLSLRIERGEFVAISGPSGSGKSTLALAMCGLLIGRHGGEAQGSVGVRGRSVAAMPLHRTARTIGLVQQNPDAHFATLTVGDEIAFGMENRCVPVEEIRRGVAEAAELLSIGHLIDRELFTLSGGEKQRVAVASIVAGRPEALVLDEPTASLDPAASRDLFGRLAELCKSAGLTVVVIEHKLTHLLPLKPRLIRLTGGRVASDTPGNALEPTPPVCLARSVHACRGRSTNESRAVAGEAIADVSGVTVELDGRAVLTDLSLRVSAGEVIGVMGPNGGGKSTLLLSLLGLVSPARGTVKVCGVRVTRKAVSRLARHVGVVFQNADHQLVADTVWGEALFAAETLGVTGAMTECEANRLLDTAGLCERKHAHPYRLSWGEKRRLNLISAMLHRPRLLLLDEPFAGQDWENVVWEVGEIRAALEGGAESGCGVGRGPAAERRGACLMVTHDPRVVLGCCTRLLFMSGGQIIVDDAVPRAFDRLREEGHDAYVPGKCAMESATGSASIGSPSSPAGVGR